MKAAGKKLRVVFDTNVLISALAFGGATARLWTFVEEEAFILVTSPFILGELSANLLRKARMSEEETEILIEEVRRKAVLVDPRKHVNIVKQNDADNRILECAIESGADVIVTGNLKHIRPLGIFQGILILTPKEFLDEHQGGW